MFKVPRCLNGKVKNRGFTLLEVLIAIFIITIGITGTFALINKTASLMATAPSGLIAAYLAQEGIEIIRNIRDTNWVEGRDWLEDLPAGDWQVDYTTTSLTNDCHSDRAPYNCNAWTLNNNLKLSGVIPTTYNQYTGEDTMFFRGVSIRDKTNLDGNPADYERVTIAVYITWTEKGKYHYLLVQEQLYRWYY